MKEKQLLRKLIAQRKKQYTQKQLSEWSSCLLSGLEGHPLFRKAGTVLLYHSLPGEVDTHEFIEKWKDTKRIVLPSVEGDELELRYYSKEGMLREGRFGISEPADGTPADEKEIELAVIPGVAFDRKGNRLGRGKGYYDRTLSRLAQAYRIGICFHFQLEEEIPIEACDLPMDEIWTERGCVSEKRYPR